MDEPHAASSLAEPRRVEYLIAVAAMAYADHEVVDAEIDTLRRLAGAIGVPDAKFATVESAARKPNEGRVDVILDGFRNDGCRFALLTDAILVAWADRHIAPGEPEELARFAQVLGVPVAQAVLLGRYVGSVIQDDSAHGQVYDLTRALAADLGAAAAKVPSPGGLRALFRRLTGK